MEGSKRTSRDSIISRSGNSIRTAAHHHSLLCSAQPRSRWFRIVETPQDTEELGGGVGGLSREDVSEIVDSLLQQYRDRVVKIKIRPEIVSGYYSIEWRYLEFDREETRWKPVGT